MHYDVTLDGRFVLTEPLRGTLERLGENLRKGAAPQRLVQDALSQIGDLPPEIVTRADGAIAWSARLHYPHGTNADWARLRANHTEALLSQPDLALLFVFHRDGHLREAALKRIHGGLPGAFFFAALAYRLNDWAAPVRQAAMACAERTFPKTKADVIAAAGLYLLDREQHWRRWSGEAAVLERAFARPDVNAELAGIICAARDGAMGAVLRNALRRPGMDSHLPRLAADAFLPSVRAVAFRSMIEGRARWPVGRERQWIDKSLGKERRVMAFAERAVERPRPLGALIAQAAADPAANVRKIAAEGMVEHGGALPNLEELMGALAGDRCKGVRERIDFLRRHQPA